MTEPTTAVATIDEKRGAIVAFDWNREQVETLKRLVAVDCTDAEFGLFAEVCKRTELDPFTRQIYAIKRAGRLTIQTGIDGFRATAERTGQLDGQDGPYWCGPDGAWTEVWPDSREPFAAKVVVYRRDSQRGFTGIAHFSEYAQKKDGRLTEMWGKMPRTMIAKCAEALALRKAFPRQLSGLYTSDEMDQADNPPPPARAEQPPHGRAAAREQMQRGPQAVGGKAPLKERLAQPAAAPALPEWARSLKETVEGWGLKMADLAVLVLGTADTLRPSQLVGWGEGLIKDGKDPYKVACDWLRERSAPVSEGADVIEGEVVETAAAELPFED